MISAIVASSHFLRSRWMVARALVLFAGLDSAGAASLSAFFRIANCAARTCSAARAIASWLASEMSMRRRSCSLFSSVQDLFDDIVSAQRPGVQWRRSDRAKRGRSSTAATSMLGSSTTSILALRRRSPLRGSCGTGGYVLEVQLVEILCAQARLQRFEPALIEVKLNCTTSGAPATVCAGQPAVEYQQIQSTESFRRCNPEAGSRYADIRPPVRVERLQGHRKEHLDDCADPCCRALRHSSTKLGEVVDGRLGRNVLGPIWPDRGCSVVLRSRLRRRLGCCSYAQDCQQEESE